MLKNDFFSDPVLAKKILDQIYRIDYEIRMLLQEIERVFELAKGIKSLKLSDMPKEGKPAAEQAFFIKNINSILIYEEELRRKVDEFYKLKKMVLESINLLESPIERQILFLKYFHYLSDKEIAERLFISPSSVYRKTKGALNNFKIPACFLGGPRPNLNAT